MSEKIAVHWFRQDLRIKDNPSLEAASKFDSFIPIYILDDTNSGEFKMGSASRWWLYHSLNKLNESLGGSLRLFKGDPCVILPKLIEDYSVSNVFWNRCYEPWRIDRDKKIKNELEKMLVREKRMEIFKKCLIFLDTRVELDQNGFKFDIFEH